MEEERKVFSPEEKLRIVLEGLGGTIQVSELCRKYGISPVTFYYWKNELLNSSREIYKSRGRKRQVDRRMREKDEEIAKLKDTIAEITTENLQLKKKNGSREVRI
jgi:transposase-like protein